MKNSIRMKEDEDGIRMQMGWEDPRVLNVIKVLCYILIGDHYSMIKNTCGCK